MGGKPNAKWYAVYRGRTPGVYRTWAEAEPLVKGFTGAQYKSFATEAEARAFMGAAPSLASVTEAATDTEAVGATPPNSAPSSSASELKPPRLKPKPASTRNTEREPTEDDTGANAKRELDHPDAPPMWIIENTGATPRWIINPMHESDPSAMEASTATEAVRAAEAMEEFHNERAIFDYKAAARAATATEGARAAEATEAPEEETAAAAVAAAAAAATVTAARWAEEAAAEAAAVVGAVEEEVKVAAAAMAATPPNSALDSSSASELKPPPLKPPPLKPKPVITRKTEPKPVITRKTEPKPVITRKTEPTALRPKPSRKAVITRKAAAARRAEEEWVCSTCDSTFNSMLERARHVFGREHLDRLWRSFALSSDPSGTKLAHAPPSCECNLDYMQDYLQDSEELKSTRGMCAERASYYVEAQNRWVCEEHLSEVMLDIARTEERGEVCAFVALSAPTQLTLF